MEKSYVKTKVDVIGYHKYANAPEDVSFLREWHRHHFIVTIKVQVFGVDREIEFFQLQKLVLDSIYEKHFAKMPWGVCFTFESCEALAKEVLGFLLRHYGERDVSVDVSEDGESSGGVEYACLEGN